MQTVTLAYYLICLIAGFSSVVCLVLITVITRDPFFTRFLIFDGFYALLIGAMLIALYLEVNYAGIFESYRSFSRLFIFFTKCGLVYTLISFTNHIYSVRGKKIIEPAVFCTLFVAAVLRVGFFLDAFAEDNNSMPVSRILVDTLLVSGLLYLFVLSMFRLRSSIPHEFQVLIRRIMVIMACFSPGLILEVLYYELWGFTVFTPALFAAVNAVSVYKLIGYYVRNYSLRERNAGGVGGSIGPCPDDFLKKYDITRREEEVVRCLLEGYTNKAIAEKLFISPSTVKAHIYNVFRKTSVKTRHQLMFRMLHRE